MSEKTKYMIIGGVATLVILKFVVPRVPALQGVAAKVS